MKYRFKVIYANKYMIEATKLLQKLDLDIDIVGFESFVQFSSNQDLSIEKIKEHLNLAFEQAECKLYQCEGGKIE